MTGIFGSFCGFLKAFLGFVALFLNIGESFFNAGNFSFKFFLIPSEFYHQGVNYRGHFNYSLAL